VCVGERVWSLFWRERERERAVYASQRESQCSLFSNSAELEKTSPNFVCKSL
jgi:hypothetical protein